MTFLTSILVITHILIITSYRKCNPIHHSIESMLAPGTGAVELIIVTMVLSETSLSIPWYSAGINTLAQLTPRFWTSPQLELSSTP